MLAGRSSTSTSLAAEARTTVDGRLVLLALLACYFAALALAGPASFWRRAGVPHMSPSFADTRSIVSGWECVRKGIAVVPTDPCDPWRRPVNYPRLWLSPAFLGIGPGATFYLGLAVVGVFLASVLAVAGRLRSLAGVVYAAAICSPAVMLGVERGNNDLVVFGLVVLALVLFRRSVAGRAVGHGLLLFAAMLKLYPACAFGLTLRQRRSWAVAGCGTVTAVFGAYAVATLDYIRTIERVSPQVASYSYGAGVLADLQGRSVLDPAARQAVILIAGLAAAAALAAARRRISSPQGDWRGADAFCVGAGIYCGSYAIFHNFDYRLIFLLLTMPELLRWSGMRGAAPLPLPRVAIAALLVTLWLGTSLPPLPSPLDGPWTTSTPLDEYLNWLLFVYLGAGLLANLGVPWTRGRGAYINAPPC